MSPKMSIRAGAIGMAAAGELLSASVQAQAADRAKATSPGAAISVVRDCPDACPEMILVPAGEFNMGSPATEEGRDPPEGPVHKVKVSSFLVGKYDVTVRQYSQFIAETHHYHPALVVRQFVDSAKQTCATFDLFQIRCGRAFGRGLVRHVHEL